MDHHIERCLVDVGETETRALIGKTRGEGATNSVAGSASVQLAQNLLSKGARVRAYDPVAIPEARLQLNGTVKYCESAYGVAEGVDALVVATGWPEFRTLDFARIRHLVKQPIIIDTKNLLDSSRLRAMGFQYMGVGRG